MKNNFKLGRRKGFTLVELLIVIAIIAILAAVVFVALDPLTRFQDARDSSRWSDVTSILSAVKIDQVDNGGTTVYGVRFDTSAAAVGAGTEYHISAATTTSGCNTNCPNVAASDDCVNIQDLVTEGYLVALPISPTASTTAWTSTYTGYYLTSNTGGSITIAACSPENTASISVTR
jgi:prepilin-type N-terminal cleavage/methylation domain-containing protein